MNHSFIKSQFDINTCSKCKLDEVSHTEEAICSICESIRTCECFNGSAVCPTCIEAELRAKEEIKLDSELKKMDKESITCSICNKIVTVKFPGQFTDILDCGHVIMKVNRLDVMAKGADATEAETITKTLSKARELPKIDGNDLVMRALGTVSQVYEDFFNAENPMIEDIIEKHGKDNAVLVFTAIHSHLSKTLFCINRFRNLYYVKIEQLRKEIEDKAVRELIQNHDFNYENLKPTPKKPKVSKTGTDIDKAKQGLAGLTGKDGNPVDVMKIMGSLMWKKKDEEKVEYKAGLDKIKESIKSKE